MHRLHLLVPEQTEAHSFEIIRRMISKINCVFGSAMHFLEEHRHPFIPTNELLLELLEDITPRNPILDLINLPEIVRITVLPQIIIKARQNIFPYHLRLILSRRRLRKLNMTDLLNLVGVFLVFFLVQGDDLAVDLFGVVAQFGDALPVARLSVG